MKNVVAIYVAFVVCDCVQKVRRHKEVGRLMKLVDTVYTRQCNSHQRLLSDSIITIVFSTNFIFYIMRLATTMLSIRNSFKDFNRQLLISRVDGM